VYVFVCVCVSKCVHVCACVCLFVVSKCVCVREREREREIRLIIESTSIRKHRKKKILFTLKRHIHDFTIILAFFHVPIMYTVKM